MNFLQCINRACLLSGNSKRISGSLTLSKEAKFPVDTSSGSSRSVLPGFSYPNNHRKGMLPDSICQIFHKILPEAYYQKWRINLKEPRKNLLAFSSILLCIAIVSCEKSKKEPFLISPSLQSAEVSFAGYTQNGFHNTTETINPDLPGASKPLQPYFSKENNAMCFYSSNPFYYYNEAGFKAKYCFDDEGLSDTFLKLQESLFENGPSVDTIVSVNALSVKIKKLTDLKKYQYRGIIDGNIKPFYKKEGMYGSSFHFENIPLNKSTIGRALPSRFPHAVPSVLLLANSVYFVYPSKGNFLVIEVVDTALIESLVKIAAAIPSICETLIGEAANDSVRITEVVFYKQSSENHFTEIGSTDKNIYTKFSIRSSGLTLESEIFLFSYATILFSQELNQFKSDQTLILNSYNTGAAQTISADSYKLSSLRSLSGIPLSPSIHCMHGPVCGSYGIHPVFEQKKEVSGCSVHDFEVTELNPYGLILKESQGRNAGGKFVEIVKRSNCKNQNVVFEAGDLLDPGIDNNDAILLFYADPDFFTEKGIYAGHLRSLSVTTDIKAINLINNEEKILRQGKNTYDFYGAASNFYGRVHSLILKNNQESFHAKKQLGLRPDVTYHAMSPGFMDEFRSYIDAYIDEILPQGSRSSTGTSYADDEFVEIFFQTNDGGPGIVVFSLEYNGSKKTFRFPVPYGKDRIVFIRGNPVCFAGNGSALVFSELSLPNQAANYTLENLNQQLSISPSLYTSMDQTIRSSLVRAGQHYVLNQEYSPSCSNTRATPGFNKVYSPFFTVDSNEDVIFHTMSGQANIIRKEGKNVTQTINYPLTLMDGDRDRPELTVAGERILVLWYIQNGAEEQLLFAREYHKNPGKLFIDAVAPTPSGTDEEWFRICTITGYENLENLYMKDSSTEDLLTFAKNRFPSFNGIISGKTFRVHNMTLYPGECAIVVDPDYFSKLHSIPFINEDAAIWTIASGTTLGNGLASGESITIYRYENDLTITPYATYGGIDTAPFSYTTSAGSYVKRKSGTYEDRASNYEVIQ